MTRRFLSVEKAIALDPRYAEAHLNKAILCSQVRRYGDTAAAYGKALALRPNLVDAWLGHGDACFALQRFDDALSSYDKAIALKCTACRCLVWARQYSL